MEKSSKISDNRMSKILGMSTDILKLILEYVSNRDKVSFLISTKKLSSVIKHIKLTDKIIINIGRNDFIHYDGIVKNVFYDQFTNLEIRKRGTIINPIRLPKNIKKLYLSHDLPVLDFHNIENLKIIFYEPYEIFAVPDSAKKIKIIFEGYECSNKFTNFVHFGKFSKITELDTPKLFQDCVPSSITSLSAYFSNLSDAKLLTGLKLEYLSMNVNIANFDQIVQYVPPTVTTLKLCICLNSYGSVERIDLNNLSNKFIKDLIFGFNLDNENIKIKGKIPLSVIKCKLTYVDDVDAIIPDNNNIRSLTLVIDNYEEIYPMPPLTKIIPSLTYLDLGDNYNYSITNILNYGLKYLNLGKRFDGKIRDHIPSTVTHLSMLGPQLINNQIPQTVTHLTLFGKMIYDKFGNNPQPFLNYYVNLAGAIPDSVTHLTFGEYFNQDLSNVITNYVTHLSIGNFFDHPISNKILNKVKFLTVPARYKKNLSNKITAVIDYF